MFQAIFGRRSSEVTQQSPLLLQRQRQIDSIRSCCPNIVEVQPDKEYRIPFVADGNSFGLEIHLPNAFPHECPVLRVSPPATHPMLDESYNVTGVPALTVFSMHVDLGRIIQGIIMEFQNHPPRLTAPLRATATFSPSPAVRGVYGGMKPPTASPPAGSPFKTSHAASQFSQLDGLTVSQLEELLRDECKLSEFVERLPEVVRSEEIKQQMVLQNEDLARRSLELKPVMEERKNSLLQKVDEVNTLKAEFEAGSEVFEVHQRAFHTSTLQDNLRVGAQAAEEESETVAQQFLDGKLSTDAFLSQFMPKRMLSHTRRAKEEKLHYQLQELHRTGF
uniref:Putative vacuolar protein sorting 37 log a n=2 Tax=Ixodes ricinus TaxID=34613 RepID=A0A131YAR3_IXORI